MALKPQGNNILAGTSLAIAQVQSPGFVEGSSGWIIRQDGSAEFNDVVIRGGETIGGSSLYYSTATPAAGTLVASVSASGGTDSAGNIYLAGTVSYTPVASGFLAVQQFAGAVFWYHAATESAGWTGIAEIIATQALSGQITFQISGGSRAQLLTTGDANVYNMARLNMPMSPAGQTINQTSAATVNNMTANLASGVTYQFEAELQYTANAAAGNPSFQVAVSATTSLLWGNGYIWQTNGTGAGTNRFIVDTSGASFQGPAMVSGAAYTVTIKGQLLTTSTGAISLQAFTSNASDTFTINNGYMNLYPNA